MELVNAVKRMRREEKEPTSNEKRASSRMKSRFGERSRAIQYSRVGKLTSLNFAGNCTIFWRRSNDTAARVRGLPCSLLRSRSSRCSTLHSPVLPLGLTILTIWTTTLTRTDTLITDKSSLCRRRLFVAARVDRGLEMNQLEQRVWVWFGELIAFDGMSLRSRTE